MTPDLRPDCTRCDALCCVLLAFDASAAFAFDKPACAACRNLSTDNSCRIHADLAAHGLKGCVAFDCHGAGQRVTAEVFKGRSWRQDPAVLPAMADAFRAMRRLHDAVILLTEAAHLPLSRGDETKRQEVLAALNSNRDWTERDLLDLETGPELKAVPAFLASLRHLDGIKPPHR